MGEVELVGFVDVIDQVTFRRLQATRFSALAYHADSGAR